MKHAILAALLLPLAACTSTPAPAPTASAPVAESAYQEMSCTELRAAARERNSDAAWARRQQQQTFSGGTDSNVSFNMPLGGGSPSVGARASSPPRAPAGLNEAIAAKHC